MNNRHLKRFLYPFLSSCLGILVMILPTQGFSASSVSAEYKLKAALLYKLTKFVEWPALSDNNSSKTFGLCVLGENYFGKSLNALKNRNVADKKISVQYYDQSEAVIGHCDLVFISDSKQAFLKPILKSLTNHSILTVGDSKEFADQGGIIQFTAGKRIGFKINIQSAKNSSLKIAAPLLQLATIVDTKE